MSAGSNGSTLVQKFNPLTGRSEWQMELGDFDYQQQLARAAFADMLHDKQRNERYHEALRLVIADKLARKEEVRVLDIGTGTGLLAIMAARLGAHVVTAVEEFAPMTKVAREVIAVNGLSDKINLVEKRSSSVQVGVDMAQKANVLVTEVFDTELIGEGAIATFNHAHQHLLTEDCITIPSSATVFAQLVSSPMASSWDRLRSVDTEQVSIKIRDSEEMRCPLLMLHDIQLEQFRDFVALTQPVPVFQFDFSGKTGPIPIHRQDCQDINCLKTGKVDAIFFWWQLQMEPTSKVILSCEPLWTNKEGTWRDHWMQAVYFPISENVVAKENENVFLTSKHDEYSFVFDVGHQPIKESLQFLSKPALPLSRTRVAELNDSDRNSKLSKALHNCLQIGDVREALFIGDASLMSMMALSVGVKRVFLVEENRQLKALLKTIADDNGFGAEQLVFIDEVDQLSPDAKIDLVFGEPYFSLSLLPWHHLLFWHTLSRLRSEGKLSESTRFLPSSAQLWALPVHFENLWKIRAPVGTTEGVDLTPFDRVIMKAIQLSDDRVEPQPLWEYPSIALAKPVSLCTLDMNKDAWKTSFNIEKPVTLENIELAPNGVALWIDWVLDSSTVLSEGPTSDVTVGSRVQWYRHSKQGVFFLNDSRRNDSLKNIGSVHCKLDFNGEEGELKFDFSVS